MPKKCGRQKREVCKQNGGGKEINGSENNSGDRRRRRFEEQVNMEMRKLQGTRGRSEIRGEKREKMVRRQGKDAGFTIYSVQEGSPKDNPSFSMLEELVLSNGGEGFLIFVFLTFWNPSMLKIQHFYPSAIKEDDECTLNSCLTLLGHINLSKTV